MIDFAGNHLYVGASTIPLFATARRRDSSYGCVLNSRPHASLPFSGKLPQFCTHGYGNTRCRC